MQRLGLNTLRPRQNGRHFSDNNLKSIFLHENVWISIKMSLKFVPRGPVNNIPALVQIMAWRRPGDKPLSGPMIVRLPTHICVTRPLWVKNEKTQNHYLNQCWLTVNFNHYSDVTLSSMASQITGVSIVCSVVCWGADQGKFKAARHRPLWGESTCDRWIHPTKGQLRGKCFHLMTSSWLSWFDMFYFM